MLFWRTFLPETVFQVQSLQCFDQQFSIFSMPYGGLRQHQALFLRTQCSPVQSHRYQCIAPKTCLLGHKAKKDTLFGA